MQDGQIVATEDEARIIREIYTLYEQGFSFEAIAGTLLTNRTPYIAGAVRWNKHNVKRILENERYAGKDGYPPILDLGLFHSVREIHRHKTAHWSKPSDDPSRILWKRLRCGECGARMLRNGTKAATKGIVQLRCEKKDCGNRLDIPLTELHAMVFEQLKNMMNHQAVQQEYLPSAEAVRLNNAINRAIENPVDPAEARRLILQGAAERYTCCDDMPVNECENNRRAGHDWSLFGRMVSHIATDKNRQIVIRLSQ
jgi:hypothetical protein